MLIVNSQRHLIYNELAKNRRRRVGALRLHTISGSICVSTKISELRKGYDLEIENKKEYKNGVVYSRFRLMRGKAKMK